MAEQIEDLPERGLGGCGAEELPLPPVAWVVLASSGQYSDWSQWAFCVCLDEQTAKDRVGELSSATRLHWAAKPGPTDDETFDDFWDRPGREEAVRAWEEGLAKIDPDASEYEQTSYTAREVPLVVAREHSPPRQVSQPIRDNPND